MNGIGNQLAILLFVVLVTAEWLQNYGLENVYTMIEEESDLNTMDVSRGLEPQL